MFVRVLPPDAVEKEINLLERVLRIAGGELEG